MAAPKKTVRYQITLSKSPGKEPTYYWVSDKTEVMVVCDKKNTLRIFQSICPHMGARLCFNKKKDLVHCPWHGLSYDAKSLTSTHRRYRRLTELKGEVVGDQLIIYG